MRFSSRRGQMFTLEFAMAFIGVIAIAFVVSRVGTYGLGWIGAFVSAYDGSRVQAGQQGSAGTPTDVGTGGGGSLNLIGPGPESLGGFVSGIVADSFMKTCSGADGMIASGLGHRNTAAGIYMNAKMRQEAMVKAAGNAEVAIAEANRLHDIWVALCPPKSCPPKIENCSCPGPTSPNYDPDCDESECEEGNDERRAKCDEDTEYCNWLFTEKERFAKIGHEQHAIAKGIAAMLRNNQMQIATELIMAERDERNALEACQ